MQILRFLPGVKKFRFPSVLLASLSLGLFLAEGQAAVVINVDINGGQTYTLSGQGAYSDPGHNLWNGFNMLNGFYGGAPVSSGALLDSTGASTGVQLTFSGGYWRDFGYTDFSGGSRATGNYMLDDMIFVTTSEVPAGLQFAFSGLTPNSAYTLYLYGDSGTDAVATTFTVNGNSQVTTGRSSASSPAIYTLGTDYAVINSMSDADGNLIGSFNQASNSGQGRFSGVQLIAAVPEPQTWALAALGASAIVFRLRRRQRTE